MRVIPAAPGTANFKRARGEWRLTLALTNRGWEGEYDPMDFAVVTVGEGICEGSSHCQPGLRPRAAAAAAADVEWSGVGRPEEKQS